MSGTTITPTHDPRRGRWIPWAFAGGMLTVVAVNAVLVVASVSTFPGLTVGRAYDRGRAYNAVLEEAARQDALGWTARVALAPWRRAGRRGRRSRGPAGAGPADGVLLRPAEGATLPWRDRAPAPGRWQAVAAGRRRPPARPVGARMLHLTGPEGRHSTSARGGGPVTLIGRIAPSPRRPPRPPSRTLAPIAARRGRRAPASAARAARRACPRPGLGLDAFYRRRETLRPLRPAVEPPAWTSPPMCGAEGRPQRWS
jgi:hypothetical protein